MSDMKLIMENFNRFLEESEVSGIAPATSGNEDNLVVRAVDGIEKMSDAEQQKIINSLLNKLGNVGDLQEGEKSDAVVKALTKIPGGRDIAAMYYAAIDRSTPSALRILALFAIVNMFSTFDVGTLATLGLDTFLGPFAMLDDILIIKHVLKKYRKAGLPSERHQDKVAAAAGEEMSPQRTADVEIEKALGQAADPASRRAASPTRPASRVKQLEHRRRVKGTQSELLTEAEMSRRAALRGLGSTAAIGLPGGLEALSKIGKSLGRVLGRSALAEAEQSLVAYLKNNADDLADKMVPKLPLGIGNPIKVVIASSIESNAEEIAKCAMSFITPDFLASLENLSPAASQKYADAVQQRGTPINSTT